MASEAFNGLPDVGLIICLYVDNIVMRHGIFTKVVAAYDYVIGGWLIIVPWVFNFSEVDVPAFVSILIGFGIVINSVFSNADFGMIRFIPRYVHYLTDLLTGLLLCIAPWLLRYHSVTVWPHLLTGLLYILLTVSIGREGGRRHQFKSKPSSS